MKNLVLALGIPDKSKEWQVQAMSRQIGDWVEANRTKLPFDNLILIPTTGETRLYWLEGEVPKDLKELQDIADKLKPVIEVALDIKIDRAGVYVRPK